METDDAYSSTGTGLERTGSLGWTEEAGGQDLRMPNCLWRDMTTAGRSPDSVALEGGRQLMMPILQQELGWSVRGRWAGPRRLVDRI